MTIKEDKSTRVKNHLSHKFLHEFLFLELFTGWEAHRLLPLVKLKKQYKRIVIQLTNIRLSDLSNAEMYISYSYTRKINSSAL